MRLLFISVAFSYVLVRNWTMCQLNHHTINKHRAKHPNQASQPTPVLFVNLLFSPAFNHQNCRLTLYNIQHFCLMCFILCNGGLAYG